jgi:hypothetical protein
MTQEQLRMQMLAGIITEGQYKAMLNEANEDLFNFIKSNDKEIAKQLGNDIYKLSNIDFDTNGDVSASPLYRDYEMVSPSSAPDATITLNGETYSIQDVISNPDMFLNKKIILQRMDEYYPEKVTIGIIEDDAIGFPIKGYKGSDISFSLTPITDGEESGKIEVGGKTIYYTMYNA